MREYGRVAPTFWTRGTGRAIRGQHVTQLVALYLMSAPGANMAGLFYVPVIQIAHEIGASVEDVEVSIRVLQAPWQGPLKPLDKGFLAYSQTAETVFVRTMARRQLGLEDGECLSPGDKRCKHVARLMRECSDPALLQAFYEEYRTTLNLPEPWWDPPQNEAPYQAPPQGPYQAPSKPGSGSGSGSGARQAQGVQGEEKPALPKVKGNGAKVKPRKASLPPDWSPKPAHYERAAELGFSRRWVDDKADTVRLWAEGKGDARYASWDAMFHNWLKRDAKTDTPDLGDDDFENIDEGPREPPPDPPGTKYVEPEDVKAFIAQLQFGEMP